MEHKSKNGKTYDICSLVEYKGGAFYDIVVIICIVILVVVLLVIVDKMLILKGGR